MLVDLQFCKGTNIIFINTSAMDHERWMPHSTAGYSFTNMRDLLLPLQVEGINKFSVSSGSVEK